MDGMKIKEYPQFQDDDEIGLLAVEQNGLAIEHLSERVKKIWKVAFSALLENGMALQFLMGLSSERGTLYERSWTIGETAIRQNWEALKLLAPYSSHPKNTYYIGNYSILKHAAKQTQNREALKFAQEYANKLDKNTQKELIEQIEKSIKAVNKHLDNEIKN